MECHQWLFAVVLFFFLCFVFSLAERKNRVPSGRTDEMRSTITLHLIKEAQQDQANRQEAVGELYQSRKGAWFGQRWRRLSARYGQARAEEGKAWEQLDLFSRDDVVGR